MVKESHPSQWGNLNIAKEHKVIDFEGKTKVKPIKAVEHVQESEENDEDPIPISQMATYYMLKREVKRALKSMNFDEHKKLSVKLEEMEKVRSFCRDS